MRPICIIIIILFVFPLSARADDQFLSTKTLGKLTMIAVLSVSAFVVRMLVNRDRREAVRLHESLGPPDRSEEFQQGFDHWRVEWYGDRAYIFRNGVLYRKNLEQGAEIWEGR